MRGMSDTIPEVTTDARIGFRDIYRAVGESEARITARINEAFNALSKDAADHEARIRVIEAAVTPLAILAEGRERRLVEVETIAAATAGAVDHFRAAQAGVFSTLSAGKQVIVVGAAIAGGAVALIDIFWRVS